MLKTCFSCGSKVSKLYNGICEKCLLESQPPIEGVKPINFKIDNFSKKISYNNIYYTQEEIEKLIPDVIKKYVKINENYILKEIWIENFEIDGHKLSFDVEVDADLKMNDYFEEVCKDLSLFDSSTEKVEYIIEAGEDLREIKEKNEENRIEGCVSDAFLDLYLDSDGKIHFSGYSDSLVIKGYMAIIFKGFDGFTKDNFLRDSEENLREFIDKSKINLNLSPNRANAANNIYEVMKRKVENL